MKIIVPMTGYGSRFVSAGYQDLKPLIQVQGKSIIEWIVRGMYDEDDEFIFICRQDHILNIPNMKNILTSLAPNVTILEIADWEKHGPVNDIMLIAEHIPDNEPIIINYCDLYVEWNWKHLKTSLQTGEYDGAVICWKGFNPSIVPKANAYASCLVGSDSTLLEIREKYYFDENRINGIYSAGVYYFNSGKLMKEYFKKTIDEKDLVAGEYYVSVTYNNMVKDGRRVWVPTVCKKFCNWGTPQDLEDYLFWINSINRLEQKLNILIPMAGAGKRFSNKNYKLPKPMLPIVDRKTGKNMPMVCAAVSDLPGVNNPNSNIIFVNKKHPQNHELENELKKYYPKSMFITVDYLTDGQASTCLIAKDYINNNIPLLISACDNGVAIDTERFEQLCWGNDIIVFTVKNNIMANNSHAYSWIKVDTDNNILDVSCKKPISNTPENDHAIIATFWFKKGEIFVNASEKMIQENDRVNGEFYVDKVIKHAIDLGYKAKVFQVDKYIGWGTPEDYEAYNMTLQYWRDFYNSDSFMRPAMNNQE